MPDSMSLFVSAFSSAVSEAAATAAKETVKSELTDAGISTLIIATSEEVTKATIQQLVGPLLNIFLKIIDPTQRKLDAIQQKLDTILAESLQTGTSLARQALTMQVLGPADEHLREQQFYAALQELEKAYSYTKNGNISDDERFKIRLTQATIAKTLGAEGAVATYINEYRSALKQNVVDWGKNIKDREIIRELGHAGHFGPSSFERRSQSQIFQAMEDDVQDAKNKLVEAQAFAKFWGVETTALALST
jgi:hypothetical protein